MTDSREVYDAAANNTRVTEHNHQNSDTVTIYTNDKLSPNTEYNITTKYKVN